METTKNQDAYLNYFKANSEQTVYILDSGKVVSRTVNFGIKGNEYLEIISGLNEGEKVILADSPFSWSSEKNEKTR